MSRTRWSSIRKSVKSWCFKASKKVHAEHASNTKAWVNRAIFSKWLEEFDDDMHSQKKSVPSARQLHGTPCLRGAAEECTAIPFTPPNVTYVIQHLHQGIINTEDKLLLNFELNRRPE